jgi:hypothetical protein
MEERLRWRARLPEGESVIDFGPLQGGRIDGPTIRRFDVFGAELGEEAHTVQRERQNTGTQTEAEREYQEQCAYPLSVDMYNSARHLS